MFSKCSYLGPCPGTVAQVLPGGAAGPRHAGRAQNLERLRPLQHRPGVQARTGRGRSRYNRH